MIINILPKARTQNLVVQELPNEVLFYDLERNRAVCLNQTAKLILEQCDGKTTIKKAIQNIEKISGEIIPQEILLAGLEKLKNSRLLNNTDFEIPKMSRRDLMQSGISFTIALPLVITLIAPSATNAQSGNPACIPSGSACLVDVINNTNNCCPGNTCTTNVNGICCLINTAECDVVNDFCCPFTHCDLNTNKCVPDTN